MNETLQILATLLAAVWFGGLVTLNIILLLSSQNAFDVRPAYTRTVMHHFFRDFTRAELVFAPLVILLTVLGGGPLDVTLVALFMGIMAAAVLFLLEPQRAAAWAEAEDGAFVSGSPAEGRFGGLNLAILGTQAALIVMGGTLLAALVVA
ncbi:MAG: hypothetical protein HC915_05750 [Anaerolineae bacterium]|nr:hypothetical protein [Anaerolineae bacterium]